MKLVPPGAESLGPMIGYCRICWREWGPGPPRTDCLHCHSTDVRHVPMPPTPLKLWPTWDPKDT